MEFNDLRNYLLSKKGTTEELPFGLDALVFKVMGKIFAIVAYQDNPLRISLKCDPEHAEALRAIYRAIKPGYHSPKDIGFAIIPASQHTYRSAKIMQALMI